MVKSFNYVRKLGGARKQPWAQMLVVLSNEHKTTTVEN